MSDAAITSKTSTCERLGGIDACLSDLYGQAIGEEGTLPIVKALLLNLVIYAPDEALAEEAMDHVSRILPSVPCRAIIAEVTTSAPAQGARVSVMCGVSERGDRKLCGEVINVHAVSGAVTGSVMPLLLPDVPVCLWVLGEIPDGKADFNDLLRVASHVITDSRKFPDVMSGLNAVNRLRSTDGGRIVQDLAWVSLHAWREAAAEHFDAPSVRSYLGLVQTVDVLYRGSNANPYPDAAPLLLASWFAERTQLEILRVFHSRDEGYVADGAQDGSAAELRMIPSDAGYDVGEVVSFRIECLSDEGPAVFETRRVSETELALSEECREVCLPPKNMAVPREDDAALATRALCSHGRDYTFESALEVALKILAQLELTDESASSLRL